MKLVLTCIDNFQEYILTNIQQLIKLNHINIIVITNLKFFSYFDNYLSNITLVDKDSLNDSYEYDKKSSMNNSFRGGFWRLTSSRFFYIYEFMKKYNVTDVIHLENDVLLYYNVDELITCVDKNFMYIPFDTYSRNIASIVYIPNSDIFKFILDRYDFDKNDMENFSTIRKKTNLIKNFPIFVKTSNLTDEQQYVSENEDVFPFVFDAAAIGQYLGGVDPRNQSGNTRGFINETCVIKYDKYSIYLENVNDMKKPFIVVEDRKIPIFNLHIHSKNLSEFI
jgi:hypothetical protein